MQSLGQLTGQIVGDLFLTLLDENQRLREMSLLEFVRDVKGYRVSEREEEVLEQIERASGGRRGQ